MSIELNNKNSFYKRVIKQIHPGAGKPNEWLYVKPAIIKLDTGKDEVVDGIVKGEYHHWKPQDVKALDRAKNNIAVYGELDDSRDLVALYAHEGAKDLPYSFRVDLFDLKYGAEMGNLDLYLLVSWPDAQNGTTSLPDGKSGGTDRPWQVAVKINDVNDHEVITPGGERQKGKLTAIGFNASVDAVQFALDKEVLRKAGWQDGQPLILQSFTSKDGDSKIADCFKTIQTQGNTIPLAITTENQTGQGRIAFAWHGNQELRNAKELNKLVQSSNGAGLINLLDTVERWKIPMELHISGTLQAGLEWSNPDFLDRIKKLVNQGLLTIQGGTFDEQIMVYFPGEINRNSLKIGADWAKRFGQEEHIIGWTPERSINGDTIEDFHNAGYKATIADYIKEWFPDNKDDNRVHKINGVDLFFIDHVLQKTTVEPDDDGLNMGMRKTLLEDALANRTDVVHLGFNDWEFVAGFPYLSPSPLPFIPKNFDKVCKWLASHPWIEVTTPTKFLKKSPSVVDHGFGHTLPTQTYLGKGIPDQWYYGGDKWESYHGYIPFNTKKPLGDQNTPGTIIYDTCTAIRNAPDNAMKELATLAFYTHIYETAWHDEQPILSGSKNRISEWERDLAGQIRHDTILTAAAHWGDKVKRGELSKKISISKIDLNQDMTKEVLVTNDRLFLLFSPVGGRLTFAACYDPEKGPVPMIGNFLAMPANEGEAEVNPAQAKGPLEDAARRLSGFRDSGYDDASYTLEVTENGGITAVSSDKKIEKQFKINVDTSTIEAGYKVDPSIKELTVGVGLSPNLLDLLKHGQEHLETIGEVGEKNGKVAVKNSQGGKALLSFENSKLVTSHRNFPQTHAIYVTGQNQFTLKLSLLP